MALAGAELELQNDALGIGQAIKSLTSALDSDMLRLNLGKIVEEFTGREVGNIPLRLSPLNMIAFAALYKSLRNEDAGPFLAQFGMLFTAFPTLPNFSVAAGGDGDIFTKGPGGLPATAGGTMAGEPYVGPASGAAGAAAAATAAADASKTKEERVDAAVQFLSPGYALYRQFGGKPLI